jgi:hypothetical protein
MGLAVRYDGVAPQARLAWGAGTIERGTGRADRQVGHRSHATKPPDQSPARPGATYQLRNRTVNPPPILIFATLVLPRFPAVPHAQALKINVSAVAIASRTTTGPNISEKPRDTRFLSVFPYSSSMFSLS